MKKISLTIPLAFATTAEQLTKSILDNQKAIQELSTSQRCLGPADSIDAWTKEFCERASQALDNANHRVTEARELANPATGNTNPPDVSPVDLGAAATLGGAAALAGMSFKLGLFDTLKKTKSKPQGSVNEAAVDTSQLVLSTTSGYEEIMVDRYSYIQAPANPEEDAATIDKINKEARKLLRILDNNLKYIKEAEQAAMESAVDAGSIKTVRDNASNLEKAALLHVESHTALRRLAKRQLSANTRKLAELRSAGNASVEEIAEAERMVTFSALKAKLADEAQEKIVAYQRAARAYLSKAQKLKPIQ